MKSQPITRICDSCGKTFTKEQLIVKRVSWRQMGMGGKVTSTRAVAWLCMVPGPNGEPSCASLDPHWDLEPYVTAPGTRAKRLSTTAEDHDAPTPA